MWQISAMHQHSLWQDFKMPLEVFWMISKPPMSIWQRVKPKWHWRYTRGSQKWQVKCTRQRQTFRMNLTEWRKGWEEIHGWHELISGNMHVFTVTVWSYGCLPVCILIYQIILHILQAPENTPPPPLFHTALKQKWGGGIYSNIQLVLWISTHGSSC